MVTTLVLIKQSGQTWLLYLRMRDELVANRKRLMTVITTPGLTSLLSDKQWYFQSALFPIQFWVIFSERPIPNTSMALPYSNSLSIAYSQGRPGKLCFGQTGRFTRPKFDIRTEPPFAPTLTGVSRAITKYHSNQYVSCWKQWRTDELVDVLCPSGAYQKVFWWCLDLSQFVSN